MQDPKVAKNSPSRYHRTIYTFATEARIDNRKKVVKQQCGPHVRTIDGELRPTSG